MSESDFAALCREAVRCRYCFDQFGLHAPAIDIAQPRWVGSQYWTADPRVLVVMLNPGSGDFRLDSADSRSRDLIRAFADGSGELDAVLDHQLGDIPNWGRGRFYGFYVDSLGLKLAATAFANIAWCATRGNGYPTRMLDACFSRFTERLVKILQPSVVLLSGAKTHRYALEIRELLPGAQVIPTLHYAHRSGKDVEQEEVERVKDALAARKS